tara:strand:- start:1443 stop:2303 length:861 start_codon:yes stop_codon:yes gene_type:complete
MPNITIPNVFVDGSSADADQASENTYLPKVPPDNLAVMNGGLDDDNRDGWIIENQDVRRGHFSRSGMVSATANQDFFDDLFIGQGVSGFPSGTWWDDAQVIPGCSVTFHIPWGGVPAVRAVNFTWHLTAVVDAAVSDTNSGSGSLKRFNAAGDPYSIAGISQGFYDKGDARLMLFINGFPVFPVQRYLLNGAASMAYDPANPGDYYNEYYAPDTRDWSGSFTFEANVATQLGGEFTNPLNWPIVRGWHTADIRLVLPAYDGTSTDATGGVRQVRVKTRRMGYTIIR